MWKYLTKNWIVLPLNCNVRPESYDMKEMPEILGPIQVKEKK